MVKAIIVSDIHIPKSIDYVPSAFVGDYFDSLRTNLGYVKGLQDKYQCPVLDGGDLFDGFKVSNQVLVFAILFFQSLEYPWVTVPGNHDLYYHRDLNKSALAVIQSSGGVRLPGDNLSDIKFGIDFLTWEGNLFLGGGSEEERVLLGHAPLVDSKDSFFDGISPDDFVKQNPEYELYVTGHNHKSFFSDRLINPGSFMRRDADQGDHVPSVYLWCDDGSLEQVVLPIPGEISREHIEKKEERDARIEAYLEKLSGEFVSTLNFRQSLEKAAYACKEEKVRHKILDLMEVEV